MSRWTNVRYDKQPATRRSATSGRKARDDYPAGPFPWSETQAVACFEAHGWAAGEALAVGLRNAWADPRPPCYPPHETLDPERAIAVMLAKFASVHGYTNKEVLS